MVDAAWDLKEGSRQFWALSSALAAHNGSAGSKFARVPRHIGLEVWRLLAEPINEDKALVQKDLLPLVTNSKPAAIIDMIEVGRVDWDTHAL